MPEPRETLLVSGWGYPEEALQPLATELGPAFRCRRSAPHLLYPSTVAADHAGGLLQFARTLRTPLLGIGWSLGAMILMEAAAREPELFSRLVLVSGCAVFCGPPAAGYGAPPEVLRAMLQQMPRRGAEVLARFGALVASSGLSEPPRPLPAAHPGLSAGLHYLLQADLREAAKSIRLPALLLHGAADRVIGPQASVELAALLPCSRLVLIEEGDHALVITQPRRAALEIRRFAEVNA